MAWTEQKRGRRSQGSWALGIMERDRHRRGEREEKEEVTMSYCELEAHGQEALALRSGMIERSGPNGTCSSIYGDLGW